MSESKKTPAKKVFATKKETPKKEAPKKEESKNFKNPEEFHKAKNELKAKHLEATPHLWRLEQGDPARAKYEKELAALKRLRN